MKERFLIEYKEGIIHNFIRKIKKFFFKDWFYKENKKDITILKPRKREEAQNIFDDLKVDVDYDNKFEKDEFMKKIKENPELLESFSIERLEKIKLYFQNVVNEKKEKLSKLN